MHKTHISVISSVLLVSLSIAARAQQQHTITTVAGGLPNNVPATQAPIVPLAVFKDSAGNLYTTGRSVVYKMNLSGQLIVVAGNGVSGFSGDGGPATSAELNGPGGVFVDSSGNVFIADQVNERIREVLAATGNIQTVAGNGTYGFSGDGGPATSAQLSNPENVFVDSSGNIFISDDGNARIREVVAATGIIQTVAGNGTYGFSGDGGPATGAALRGPSGLFVDGSGNIFFADSANHRIREVDAATGNIQTVAGTGAGGFAGDGGLASAASLDFPTGVFLDNYGNIFIADSQNNRIREVVAATGNIQTVAGDGVGCGYTACPSPGDGGPATSAELNSPEEVFVDSSANIFIADTGNLRVREVSATTGNIQTVAGNGTVSFGGDGGPAVNAQLNGPEGVFVDGSGNIFIADRSNNRIREVVAVTGNIQTVAGNGSCSFSGDGGPATSAALCPGDVALDGSGNIFIADTVNNRIRKVDAATGNIQTVAGNGVGFCDLPGCPPLGDGGPATSAKIAFPDGVFVDKLGDIFISDFSNGLVREVIAATGTIETVAGDEMNTRPVGIFGDTLGNIFFADSGPRNGIFEVPLGVPGVLRHVAGNGSCCYSGDGGPATSAALNFPTDVFLDSAGNIFIADPHNARIREVDAVTGDIQTVAGDGIPGFSGDGGPATSAELEFPVAVWGDLQGNLFIADDDRIRKVSGLVAVVGVTVGPSTVTVGPSATQQFTASVTNATNTAVTWSLTGTGCSGSGCGTISPQGLYTAPAASGSPLTVTLTATSVADDTKSATATITVPAKQASSVRVSSSANPSVLGQTVTLTATVSPSSSSGAPTGTVTFSDGANTLATVPLNSSASAALTASSLAVAAHPITVTYSGDNSFFASAGSLTENVSYAVCPLYDQTRLVPRGATFPIKLYLCDAGGNDVSSTAVALHATQITSASGYSGSMSSPGSANLGCNFRFNAWLGPAGGYIFNLSTAGLPPGKYSLQFTAGGDPLSHAANFAVR
jgi:sugar lactone lactonase YvrE